MNADGGTVDDGPEAEVKATAAVEPLESKETSSGSTRVNGDEAAVEPLKSSGTSPGSTVAPFAPRYSLRLAWVADKYGLLTCKYASVAYIDETWFYKMKCCRAMKVLPKVMHETGK